MTKQPQGTSWRRNEINKNRKKNESDNLQPTVDSVCIELRSISIHSLSVTSFHTTFARFVESIKWQRMCLMQHWSYLWMCALALSLTFCIKSLSAINDKIEKQQKKKSSPKRMSAQFFWVNYCAVLRSSLSRARARDIDSISIRNRRLRMWRGTQKYQVNKPHVIGLVLLPLARRDSIDHIMNTAADTELYGSEPKNARMQCHAQHRVCRPTANFSPPSNQWICWPRWHWFIKFPCK